MRPRGFTLVEAMVVVSLIALLLAAGMPSFGSFIRNQRVRTAAESLETGLQQARNEAVRRNTSISFWLVSLSDPAKVDNSCALSGTSGSWVISVSSPGAECGAAPSTTVAPMIVSASPMGETVSVAISAVQSDGTVATHVTFNGFGQVSNADAIARISVASATTPNSYRRLRVDVSSGGQVRMCDLGVTDNTDPRYCA